jgi:hypothetical protein
LAPKKTPHFYYFVDRLPYKDGDKGGNLCMKKYILSLLVSVSILSGVLSPAAGKDRLIAYPVPLSPATQTMKLHYGSTDPSGIIMVEIFDVNGEKVFSRSYSALSQFAWKGYTNKGKHAGAGLYIVKVRMENTSTGAVSTDTVRILVKR